MNLDQLMDGRDSDGRGRDARVRSLRKVSGRHRVRRWILRGAGLVVIAFLGVGVVLAWLTVNPRVNPAPQVDAILVLYTEDAVYDRAVELANEGVTDLLIVSNPEGASDGLCEGARTDAGAEVVCFSPEPVTTQGEAIIGSELARERGVENLGVLTFDNHLERSRVIVSRCWDSALNLYEFERNFDSAKRAYQVVYGVAAFGKTVLTPGCTTEFPRPVEGAVEWVKDLTRPKL